MGKTLIIEKHSEAILMVTLNRPEVRNAINYQMMGELRDLWQQLKKNPESLRCVILTGSGDKAFCAGADLKERHNLALETWKEQHEALEKAMVGMIECPIPIIAAVNGAAYGGGLELALASDFAYAATTATFAQSETKVGLIPGAMGTQNLPKACGIRRAKELCFTAEAFSAEQAFQWGIINKICKPAELMSEVMNVAKIISANSPLAVRYAKQSLNASQHLEIHAGFDVEIEFYNRVLLTKDREEGIKAFNEKRQPEFQGE